MQRSLRMTPHEAYAHPTTASYGQSALAHPPYDVAGRVNGQSRRVASDSATAFRVSNVSSMERWVPLRPVSLKINRGRPE